MAATACLRSALRSLAGTHALTAGHAAAPFARLGARALSTDGAAAAPLTNVPRAVSLEPKRVPVEEGKTYYWCACGYTRNEPWCDGSHKTLSTIRSVKWVAPKSGMASICACRQTKREGRVLCDGGHVHLKSGGGESEGKA